MAAGAKERAHEVLSALLREVKDEPRVRRIVDDALLRLRSSRCRPCWWKTPEIGDDAPGVLRVRAQAASGGDIAAGLGARLGRLRAPARP